MIPGFLWDPTGERVGAFPQPSRFDGSLANREFGGARFNEIALATGDKGDG